MDATDGVPGMTGTPYMSWRRDGEGGRASAGGFGDALLQFA
jgi:hypothetical protein